MELKEIKERLENLKEQQKNTENLHLKLQGAIEVLEGILASPTKEEPKKAKTKK